MDLLNKKLPVHVTSLLLIYALLATPLVATQAVTITGCLTLLLIVLGSYYIGAVLLIPVNITGLLLPVSHAAISIFLGSLVFSMAVFITTGALSLSIILLIISIIIATTLRKKTILSFGISTPGIVLFAMALLFICMSSEDLTKQFSAHQAGTDCYPADSYYFNAVVASIRKGTIYSAVYEKDAALNYQLFGFFIPALWADMLNISSHLSLWGLALPFYKLLIVLFCYELCFYYLKDKVSRNNYVFIALSVTLPILLAPLHPLYVLKGNVTKFIFYGISYLVPAGTIPFPIAIVLLLFCLFLFAKIDWKNRRITADKLLFIFFLSAMIIAKFPMYVSFVFFLGGIILKRVLFDKEKITNYLGYGITSVLLSFIIYKVCMDQASGGHNYFKYGFLAELFGSWYGKKPVGLANNIIITALIILSYLLWTGLRLLGLLGMVRSKMPKLAEYLPACLLSLLGATIMASFLRIETVNSKGQVISDNTFNSLGFIRSSFYFISIVGTIGILYFIYASDLKRRYVNAIIAVTVIWCGLALMTTAKTMWPNEPCPPVAWYYENYDQLKTGKYNDGLIVINPNKSYYGIMLSSSDLGSYWSCVDRSGTSYNATTKNEYRWDIFKNLLQHPEEQYLLKMKNEGVKYIITTPVDSQQIARASTLFPRHLQKVKDTRWIYQVD
jgi:hypothetical protein